MKPEVDCLAFKQTPELGAIHMGNTRKVINDVGGRDLAARNSLLNQNGIKTITSRVDSGGIAGRSSTEDSNVVHSNSTPV